VKKGDDGMMRYVAGWDGGGTKTAITVADETGRVILTFTSGAINLNGQDEKSVRASIQDAVMTIGGACGGLENCAHMCIGAAGVSNPTVVSRLMAMVRQAGYSGGLTVTGDHETALFGGLESGCGIVLIAGTGSICFGRNASGMMHRTGGGGHLVDDEGSGYSIGRELISAALKTCDGRMKSGLIAPMVFSWLQVTSVKELIGFVYSPGTNKKDIAALAPLLSELCAMGDSEAIAIANRSARALLELTVPVVERLSLQTGRLALTGSVLLRNDLVRGLLAVQLHEKYPDLECFPAKQNASQGAVLMALEKLREET
jgi:N-acetylglucosamine kinase-like BadF-type ATPase